MYQKNMRVNHGLKETSIPDLKKNRIERSQLEKQSRQPPEEPTTLLQSISTFFNLARAGSKTLLAF